ncbi:MAG: transglutaminase-like domain-containing protein, partial [Armatimonadota bacterium]
MLFLSLPCITLFAYVGMFDVWRPAILLFFVFLVCVAVLYARSYLRVMVERAQTHGAEPHLLRRDMWKWVAGPEWAFASAAVVIVISLMVGPMLQIIASPVSGAVRIPTPASRNNNVRTGPISEARVGTGTVSLSETPVFKVKSSDGVYFRRKSFFDFNGDGWNSSNNSLNINSLMVATSDPTGGTKIENSRPSAYEPINKPRSSKFTFQFVDQGLVDIPEPGIFTHVDANVMDLRLDRTSVEVSSLRKTDPITVDVDLPSESPVDRPASIPGPYPSKTTTPTSDSVRALADSAVSGISNDFDRCEAIAKAVGERCKYTTSLPPIPTGKDKVDFFLNESKEGYCDMFATSFIVMARAKGIQARYVVGWHCEQDRTPDKDGYRVVTEKD